MRYAIVIETGPEGCAAYAPDLPGCVAFGATVRATIAVMREALDFHIEGLCISGEPVPPPTSLLPAVMIVASTLPS